MNKSWSWVFARKNRTDKEEREKKVIRIEMKEGP